MKRVALFFILTIISAAYGAENPASAPASQPVSASADNIPGRARITDDGWFAPITRSVKPKLPSEINRAFVIPMRQEISVQSTLFETFKRKAERCRMKGAEIVIIDMDTWGGGLGTALDLARYIKTDMKDVYIVCYVRTRAVSAGALIALACNEIIMAEQGKFGDCAPIIPGGKLEGVEREKAETVVRTEFEESARLNGYNVPLSLSMVSADLEVWLVRNKKTGELRYELADDYRGKVDNPPSEKDDNKTFGKVSNPQWSIQRVVVKEGKLLTMESSRAKEYGFIEHIIPYTNADPFAGLVEHFNIKSKPVVLVDTWGEKFVYFLTSPTVSSILVFLMLMLAFSEMRMPGFGICGGLAIVCLIILLFGHYLIGMAQWWEIAFFVVGIALILAEIFVIPGFGIAGVSGIILVLVGGFAMLVPNLPNELPVPDSAWAWSVFKSGLMSVCLAFIASVIGTLVLAHFLPKMPFAGRLVLKTPEAEEKPPCPETSTMLKVEVGDVGVAQSVLRPVGQVRFEAGLVDAVSEMGLIKAGARVRVLRHDSNRIIVKEEKA